MRNRLLVAACFATTALSAPAYAVDFKADLDDWKADAPAWLEDQQYGDDFTDISSVTLDGGPTLTFGSDVNVRTIGSGWATWCCAYTGQVLYTNGATSISIDIAPDVTGFGFYAEPNPFATYEITLALTDGSSLSRQVAGDAGAKFFGWNGAGVSSFTISSTVDFAFGDFFYEGGAPVPEPATWAMMISGFGLVGGAMRRARVSKLNYSAA